MKTYLLQTLKEIALLGAIKNKIEICESEASETQYWLEIISKMEWLDTNETVSDYNECSELVALFTTISNNCKQ